MSESTVSVFIAVAVLVVLALFVPCMESLARFLRHHKQKPSLTAGQQSSPSSSRKVA